MVVFWTVGRQEGGSALLQTSLNRAGLCILVGVSVTAVLRGGDGLGRSVDAVDSGEAVNAWLRQEFAALETKGAEYGGFRNDPQTGLDLMEWGSKQ